MWSQLVIYLLHTFAFFYHSLLSLRSLPFTRFLYFLDLFSSPHTQENEYHVRNQRVNIFSCIHKFTDLLHTQQNNAAREYSFEVDSSFEILPFFMYKYTMMVCTKWKKTKTIVRFN